jgi:hypothetical protein
MDSVLMPLGVVANRKPVQPVEIFTVFLMLLRAELATC